MIKFIKIPLVSAENMWYSQIQNNINKGFKFHKYQKIDIKEKAVLN